MSIFPSSIIFVKASKNIRFNSVTLVVDETIVFIFSISAGVKLALFSSYTLNTSTHIRSGSLKIASNFIRSGFIVRIKFKIIFFMKPNTSCSFSVYALIASLNDGVDAGTGAGDDDFNCICFVD